VWSYLARRLAQSAVIVVLVATFTFVLLQLAPGDPCTNLQEGRSVSGDVVERCRRQYGLDRPILEQYVLYLSNLARGTLGYSSANRGIPVWDIIGPAIPRTMLLAAAALLINFTLGIAVGTYQAARANSRADRVLTVVTVVFFSMPVFWLGLVLILLVAEPITWIPASGTTTPVIYETLGFFGRALDRLRHLMLPALTLGMVSAAVTARFQRAAMLDTITADFIRTARAKGLRERTVLLHHALRNSLLPIITLFGLTMPVLLSGSVLVEQVFGWNGMGWITITGILQRDYHVVTAAAILAAFLVVIGNLVADLLYHVADPRTRTTP
jgi:peptide/nickel transport system permease protein